MSGPLRGGLLIAVEGIDGAGKTTVAAALGEQLRACGNTVTVSKEPTRGPWGAKLRASAASGRLSVQEELNLFRLDRKQHVDELIAPALSRDEVVILDRYFYSTAAYQGAAGADVESILSDNIAFAPVPDVVLLLDVPVEVGLARIRARGDSPNRFETTDTLEACRAIFNSILRPEIRRISGERSIADVFTDCVGQVLLAASRHAIKENGFTPAAGEALLELVGTL